MGSSLLDVTAAATFLNVSEKTVRRWANAGELGHVRAGKLLRFRQEDLDVFVAARTVQAARPRAVPPANTLRTRATVGVSNSGGWRPPETTSDQHVRGRRVS